jgi:hypothetical protein
VKALAESCWELNKTKILGGECIWLHIAKKNEEYHVRGSYKNKIILLATIKKLNNTKTLCH